MLPILNAQEMKDVDARAMRIFSIPSTVLMENAGRCVVEEMEKRWGSLDGKSILVIAGKGNNGGDGFVAARYAHERNAEVTVSLVGNERELRGDALLNFEKLRGIHDGRLSIERSFSAARLTRRKFNFVVDAIFGTSFRGEVSGRFAKVIRWVNEGHKGTIVAIDIPSGVDASTGECRGDAVRADLTVTMAFPKIGLYFGKGRAYSGSISVADIGIRETMTDAESFRLFLVEETDVWNALPVRPVDAHKHSVGKIFILAGSRGLTGAALLSSRSAMRAGAGAVVLGVPSAVLATVARRTLEVMPLELDSTSQGTVALTAIDAVEEKISWADVVLVGPGLSQHPETQELARRVISRSAKSMVVDADGLNALVDNRSILRKRKGGRIVLTPHVGEFARLTKIPSTEIERNKVELGREYAQKNNVVLVLKGAPTIVADPSGKVFVNPTGNPGMATAGSGDVLAGIIAALIGQGNDVLQAAVNGAYVHGAAGDFAREKMGEMGMVASDILAMVPSALKTLQKGKTRR